MVGLVKSGIGIVLLTTRPKEKFRLVTILGSTSIGDQIYSDNPLDDIERDLILGGYKVLGRSELLGKGKLKKRTGRGYLKDLPENLNSMTVWPSPPQEFWKDRGIKTLRIVRTKKFAILC